MAVTWKMSPYYIMYAKETHKGGSGGDSRARTIPLPGLKHSDFIRKLVLIGFFSGIYFLLSPLYADDISKFFFFFQKKTGFGISCGSLYKCQSLYFL